jgi:hypothetical protein
MAIEIEIETERLRVCPFRDRGGQGAEKRSSIEGRLARFETRAGRR